jgi:pyridoxine 5'-phosphate synthase PdxJ
VHVGHALVAQALFDGVERSIEQFNTLVGEHSRQ